MASARQTRGHALAALGGASLIGTLWLPWYSFRIPAAALDYATQMAHQFGILGPLISQGAQLLSRLGPLHVTAWHALETIPIALLVIGIVAGGLSALAAADRAAGAGRLTVVGAAAAIALVGYRIVEPPVQGGLVQPAWGIYASLAAAVAMLAGAAIAGSGSMAAVPTMTRLQTTPDPESRGGLTAQSDGWSTADSVPPPAR